jgi:hypothetical protein
LINTIVKSKTAPLQYSFLSEVGTDLLCGCRPHNRVAHIASAIASDLSLTLDDKTNLLLAGPHHDCGALSLRERIHALQSEVADTQLRAEQVYLLLPLVDPTIIVRRPIGLGILIVAAIALLVAILPTIKAKREEAFKEE